MKPKVRVNEGEQKAVTLPPELQSFVDASPDGSRLAAFFAFQLQHDRRNAERIEGRDPRKSAAGGR